MVGDGCSCVKTRYSLTWPRSVAGGIVGRVNSSCLSFPHGNTPAALKASAVKGKRFLDFRQHFEEFLEIFTARQAWVHWHALVVLYFFTASLRGSFIPWKSNTRIPPRHPCRTQSGWATRHTLSRYCSRYRKAYNGFQCCINSLSKGN